jgi:hypothetical protein
VTSSSVLAGLPGGVPGERAEPPDAGPALLIRRCQPADGPTYWRWDCRRCGEYGGARSHPDAVARAGRHCAEHPGHRSSLVPPVRCRLRQPTVHPALFLPADEEAGPPPLDI